MKKKVLLILCILLCVTACGKATPLKDGEDVIATYKSKESAKENDEKITATDLYEILKETYGGEKVVDMIDTLLLEKEYDVTEEEKQYIKDTIKTVEESAEQYNTDFITYINYYYDMKTKEAFEEYVRLNYRRNQWAENYSKETVTEKQINQYYETTTIGDIDAKHILISANTTEEMSDTEKTKAEEKALKIAKEVIKKLNNKEKFDDLAKEYSDDTATAENGGNLGKFNRGVMDANFKAAAIDLKVGEYSKTPVKSAYGYHIIYKISQDEKPKLKTVREKIIETVGAENLKNDQTVYYKGMVALREKYGVSFKDEDLKKAYDKIVLNYGIK